VQSTFANNTRTLISTSGDSPVVALTVNQGVRYANLIIVNGGSAAGYASIDNGQNWLSFTATVNSETGRTCYPGLLFGNNNGPPLPVLVRRIPGGSDLSSVEIFIY
jgi:hypothetical protein